MIMILLIITVTKIKIIISITVIIIITSVVYMTSLASSQAVRVHRLNRWEGGLPAGGHEGLSNWIIFNSPSL